MTIVQAKPQARIYPTKLSPNLLMVQSGQTIQGVIDSITDAAVGNPYTVMVPPGVYAEQVVMKDYVNLTGSGCKSTIITHKQRYAYDGTIHIATATLANMTVIGEYEAGASWRSSPLYSTEDTGIVFNCYNCYLPGDWDVFYGDKDAVDCVYNFFNCEGFAHYDGWANYSSSCEMRLFSCICTIEAEFSSSRCVVSSTEKEDLVMGCHLYAYANGGSGRGVAHAKITGTPTSGVKVIGTNIDVDTYGLYAGDASGRKGYISIFGGDISGSGKDIYNRNAGIINVYGAKYTTSSGIISGKHDAEDETANGTYTLNPSGVTKIDSSGGAVTGTLGSGHYIGQRKHIVMTDSTASSTISATNHETSDPEIGTFDAVDEVWILEWSGTEWVTIKATCTFV